VPIGLPHSSKKSQAIITFQQDKDLHSSMLSPLQKTRPAPPDRPRDRHIVDRPVEASRRRRLAKRQLECDTRAPTKSPAWFPVLRVLVVEGDRAAAERELRETWWAALPTSSIITSLS
jgi:hypothetical protein